MNFTLRAIENCYSEYKLTITGFKAFVDSKFHGVIEFKDHKIPLVSVSYIDRRTNNVINMEVNSVYVTTVNELKICGTVNDKEHEIAYTELDMCDVLWIIKDILICIENNSSIQAKCDLLDEFLDDTDYSNCLKNTYSFPDMLNKWLSGVKLSDYILDKKYIDISWIEINGTIYDNDALWESWRDFNESK